MKNNKVDIKGSIILEPAKVSGTTTGYLLNGEVSVDMRDEIEIERGEIIDIIKFHWYN